MPVYSRRYFGDVPVRRVHDHAAPDRIEPAPFVERLVVGRAARICRNAFHGADDPVRNRAVIITGRRSTAGADRCPNSP